MGLIFDVLSKYAQESKIEFAVPLEHIQRIYRWSNVHIHTGLKDFSWKYLIAYKYLWTLMAGKRIDGRRWIDYGIETDERTLEEIQDTVKQRLDELGERRDDVQADKSLKKSRYKLATIRAPHILIKPLSRNTDSA
jgi:hypothetical protein